MAGASTGGWIMGEETCPYRGPGGTCDGSTVGVFTEGKGWSNRPCLCLATEATGPLTERSGVPNPEPDGLVTVELTREEAEHAMARGEHPSNAPMIPDFSCPDCKRIAAKFRASLERTGK